MPCNCKVHCIVHEKASSQVISRKTRLPANEELEGHVLISWRSAARAPTNMAAPAFLMNYSSLDTLETRLYI